MKKTLCLWVSVLKLTSGHGKLLRWLSHALVRFSSRSVYITFVAGSLGDLEIFLILLLTQRHKGTETQSFLTGLTGLTRLGNESLPYDKRILTQRSRGAEEDEESSVSLSLWVSVIKLTQRHRGRESLTFLTGLTGLTRLGNESLLCDKIILTQSGKGAEGQRRMLFPIWTFEHSNIQTLTLPSSRSP